MTGFTPHPCGNAAAPLLSFDPLIARPRSPLNRAPESPRHLREVPGAGARSGRLLVLLARNAVLQVQLRRRPDQDDRADGQQPQLPESDAEGHKADATGHGERPDRARREEAQDTSAVLDLSFLPVLESSA